MKQKRLGRKLMTGFILLAVVLILCICIPFSVQFWNARMDMYSELAFSYAHIAVDYIDGDRVLPYAETGVKDDYYDQVQEFLNITQRHTDVLYYYVFVPYEDDLVYVWDADQHAGAQALGYHEAYMEGGKQAVAKVFRRDPAEEISVARDAVYGYIASAYVPVFDSAGEPVAVVGVDLSMPDIVQELLRAIGLIVLCVVVVTSLSLLLFFHLVRRQVVQPINRLNVAAQQMAGNLERACAADIDVHTGDEIEELAQSFLKMDGEVRDYIRRLSAVTAEKERIGAELSVATHIQSSMLPCIFPAFPERREFDIFATMDPAKEVGGDFYDFFMVDERHLAIVMADVSGKGVPAALFMVIGKTLIKDHTQPGADLGEVFAEVNDLLCQSNSESLFITAFEGVLDLQTGVFTYANAGHEPPFVYRKGQGYAVCPVEPCFVLAGLEGITYRAGSMQLAPGDKVFQYTDGVTEAANAAEEPYGMERLTAVLNRHADAAPMALLPTVKADIDAFVGEAPQFDDITMLCLEYREPMQG